MIGKKIFFVFFLFVFTGLRLAAQSSVDSSFNDGSKQLNDYQKEAADLYNSFKNGPAFDMLQQYGTLKEKEFLKQKEEELTNLESKFKIDYSRRQQELKDIQGEVDLLKKENDSLEKEKQKLARNTILFFVLLISFLTGILISRKRLAKKAQELAEVSTIQLKSVSKLTEASNHINDVLGDLKSGFNSAAKISADSVALTSKILSIASNQNKQTGDLEKTYELLMQVQADSEQSVLALQTLRMESDGAAEEKVMTNLNAIINEVFDVSYYWIKSFDSSFECSRIKDLEKILPEINIMPVAITTALFHLFNNAFYSVNQKKKTVGKSYEPKISVTTRKLPRFVQVRIKDNGIGMDDKMISQIYHPFFTGKPPEKAFGLGLTKVTEIIKKKHGGEIIIESEPGNGSDFIVRFPINSLM
jgi:two-component system NtrC family sensor kinase